MNIEQTGRESLRKAVQFDIDKKRTFSTEAQLWEKYDWVIKRAEHYAEKTGLHPDEILNAWEEQRDYWYQNYYQEANQPEITADTVRVFENVEELLNSIGDQGFRCPSCEGVSKKPYSCSSGVEINGKVCDWKAYGLFGTLGKGITVFVKDKVRIETIFMPIAWE